MAVGGWGGGAGTGEADDVGDSQPADIFILLRIGVW